ncbi:Ferrous iron transport permease EfeU [Klebsiella pneumoniae]|uniref:Ferrous iron transport permease EfeU n=1 Tax=Klebsiella pneumoniae TaxID=573 RepID=A0A2X3F7M2_KLEPN|nr:Ferrous iron transport permease EfeU [Klebsiella pneumoniae]
MVFWMRNVSRNVKQQLEQAVDKALQRGNHHGWALVMMVFFAVAREGLESVFFLLAAFQQDVGIWPPLGALPGSGHRYRAGLPDSTGAVSALTLACSSNGPACLFCWWPLAWPRGRSAPSTRRACWNLFQDTAFDLSNVLSTHTLFGTLLEGIFGYQETPSVSEVAVYLLYLIPALVLFALPPRNNTTASRAA